MWATTSRVPTLMFRISRPGNAHAAATPAEQIARAIAGRGFGVDAPLPDEPVSGPIFHELLAVAGHDRLLGAVAEAVAEGALAVTAEQLTALTAHHTDWARHALQVERVLLSVADCFGRAGVDFRVLKGIALSHLVYDDPSWRVFSDVDLLVPSAQFDEAVRIARTELGGEQPVPELRPGFDHEFGKEALIQVGTVEVDIHRTFVTGPFGLTIDLDELFRSSTPFVVGGRSFAALAPPTLFLHACYNLALGDYPVRLCSVRDLLVIADRYDLGQARILEVAESWGATAVVQRAAQLAMETVMLEPTHDLSAFAELSVPRREAWLIRSYLTTARSYSRPLASLVVIKGVRPRLRYALALLSPSADYLRSRGWTERSHLRLACDRLLRRG